MLILLTGLAACTSSSSRTGLLQEPARPEVYATMLASQRSRIESLFPGGSHRSRKPGGQDHPVPGPMVASALWFDSDGTYGAKAIQAAMDSGAQVVVVPALPGPWLLDTTILLRSNLELIFEEGCLVKAMPGAFMGTGETLFQGDGVRNLDMSGYGASLIMRKADYQRAPYKASQWRHGLYLRGTRNVQVRGLTISSSGGDGVYLGSLPSEEGKFRIPCQDTVLSDLILSDHHRQGISVVSATGLLIERCTIQGTKGTLPGAGIDFEPNSRDQGFSGCVVKECIIRGNAGPGILVALGRLPENTLPLLISLENNVVRGQSIAFSLFGAARYHHGVIVLKDNELSGFRLTRPRGNIQLVFKP